MKEMKMLRKKLMKALLLILFLCVLPGICLLADDLTVEQNVQTVFGELRNLKFMQPGQSYTVRVGETEETGLKEKFLRRRTAQEISASGLSCGCGDYAILFIDRIEPRGFQALLVDGAEISSQSLKEHFSGHAVVAIRSKAAPEDASWWLVDSTNLKILSRDWSPTEKNFQAFGCIFWIGYCGPLADYPVHNGEDLQAFYTKTIAAIPPEFLNHNLCRLRFTIDSSLIGKDGVLLNPRLAEFQRIHSDIFTTYGVKPERELTILLTRGGNGDTTSLTYSKEAGWVGHLGLESACSPSLLFYFERVIRSHEKS
jgi:hypothetical protein